MSFDLKIWTTIAAQGTGQTFSGGKFLYSDLDAPSSELRFYRVREE